MNLQRPIQSHCNNLTIPNNRSNLECRDVAIEFKTYI